MKSRNSCHDVKEKVIQGLSICSSTALGTRKIYLGLRERNETSILNISSLRFLLYTNGHDTGMIRNNLQLGKIWDWIRRADCLLVSMESHRIPWKQLGRTCRRENSRSRSGPISAPTSKVQVQKDGSAKELQRHSQWSGQTRNGFDPGTREKIP